MLIIKGSHLNNSSEKIFCQAYYCNFLFSQKIENKNIVSIFSLIKASLFYSLCFSIYKIVDSENSTDNCKSSKISIEAEAAIKKPEM